MKLETKKNRLITSKFIKYGYFKFKLRSKEFKCIKQILVSSIKKNTSIKKPNLEKFHNQINIENLNKVRLNIFKQLNNKEDFANNVYNSSRKYIDLFVGNELCKSDINLSIQLPGDKSSLLEMHTDFFSGESQYQVNLWIPFTKVKKTQSLFIINPKESIKILKKIKNDKNLKFSDIEKNYKSKMTWINLYEGEGLLFSPNCLHGNVVNREKNTRWSINVRFKNLFSPFGKIKNEKNILSFYKPYTLKAITQFNLEHNFDEII
jgi:sporadic carbohydrate cluster 2OG-Fe(II) oxygenase